MFRMCLFFLVLSGAAALIYQVTWVRLLGLSMGSTSAAVGTVLAAFFLGMSLGSYLSRHFVRPGAGGGLGPYVVLEVLIGLFGLILLPVLLRLDVFMALFPVLGGLLSFKFLVAIVLLSVPSICIGATFPVMANALIQGWREIGSKFGLLYSFNTLGAVLGAFLSGFVIIPAVGLDGAIYTAVACNFVVAAVGGLWLVKGWKGERAPGGAYGAGSSELPRAPEQEEPDRTAPPLALVILFSTGFASIASEVGFTKYASVFAGTTIYGFSAILTAFLIGITAGSWAIHPRVERMAARQAWVTGILLLLGLSLALTRSWLGLLPWLNRELEAVSLAPDLVRLAKYAAVFGVLLPATFLFGALFPLNLRLYCGDLAGLRKKAGVGYAVNTLGGILGSIAAGFLIIPRFGTDALLGSMAAVMVLMALLSAVSIRMPAVRTRAVAASLVLLAAVVFLPGISYRSLISSTDLGGGKELDYLYLEEGKTAIVSLTRSLGPYVVLASNGLPEAGIRADNPNFGGRWAVMLGAIPYLFHKEPRSAFLVGFGGGLTTYALTTTDLERVHVTELEPAVVHAVRSLHGGPIPALGDPRVRLSLNDARNALLLDPASYDLVISQPSHPWVAGTANVFTRQFYELAASKMNEGAIFAQWLTFYRMDVVTVGSILKAFYGVFPYGMVMGGTDPTNGSLILIGSRRPVDVDLERIGARLSLPAVRQGPIGSLLKDPYDLLEYHILSRNEALRLAEAAPENTDTNIFSEAHLAGRHASLGQRYRLLASLVADARFDLATTTGPIAPEHLYDIGMAMIADGDFGRIRLVESRLAEQDAALWRQLHHHRLLGEYAYPEAAALYRKHEEWPDASRVQQAVAFLEMGRVADADQAIDRISDTRQRRILAARSLFVQRRLRQLAQIQPMSPGERAWQLLGLVPSDPDAAARGLLEIAKADAEALDVPQLRVLAAYQARHPERFPSGFEPRTRLLLKVVDRGNLLVALAEKSFAEGDARRAGTLLSAAERVAGADFEPARRLREKMSRGGV